MPRKWHPFSNSYPPSSLSSSSSRPRIVDTCCHAISTSLLNEILSGKKQIGLILIISLPVYKTDILDHNQFDLYILKSEETRSLISSISIMHFPSHLYHYSLLVIQLVKQVKWIISPSRAKNKNDDRQ